MRNLWTLLWIVVLSAGNLAGQNLLPLQWKFQKGDSLVWAQPRFDDKDWPDILCGSRWEEQGYNNYDGFAWYRTSVVIPSRLKAEALKRGGLILKLGRIDDADYTYLNGELLGKTGDLPPHYQGAYEAERRYIIAPDKVLWDRPNVIAVRVFDDIGGGGIYSSPIELTLVGASDLLGMQVAHGTANGIYPEEEEVKLQIQFDNGLKEKVQGTVSLEVYSDFKREITRVQSKVVLSGGQQKTIPVSAGKLPPGFYVARVLLSSEVTNKVGECSFGVAAEKIVSPPDPQPDFDDYWIRARRELDAVTPQFSVKKIDSLCTDRNRVYLVEMRSLGNILIRGWYITPVAQGKYPAVLKVQGYATDQQASWGYFADDVVSFVLNIRGHGNSRDNCNPGFPGFLTHNLGDKELYIYRGAYMDCIRAVDFLCSRPEVDGSRIAVEGGSQGGALSFATAALDKRIMACAPDVPFLSDFKHYFQIAPWPNNEFETFFVAEHRTISWDQAYTVLSYIDIKNLAPRITCPVFMQIGLLDNVCPPHINFAAYNNLQCQKSYYVYPYAGHGLPTVSWDIKRDWLRRQFGL
jgi:cephalosporin-C deacetylase-like acetyl esterase